jgi:hypothetical protein
MHALMRAGHAGRPPTCRQAPRRSWRTLYDLLLYCRVVLDHGVACRPVGPGAALQGLAVVRQQDGVGARLLPEPDGDLAELLGRSQRAVDGGEAVGQSTGGCGEVLPQGELTQDRQDERGLPPIVFWLAGALRLGLEQLLRGHLQRGPFEKSRDALLRVPGRRRGNWAAPRDGAAPWSAGNNLAALQIVNCPWVS